MTDTARLREALTYFQDTDDDPTEMLTSNHMADVYAAARELLTLREAGALIITPDEKTIEHAARALEVHLPEDVKAYSFRFVETVLDALRDAMPDGGSQ